MAKPKQSEISYQALQQELDQIMLELQREDLDIDKVLQHYQRGLEVVQELEKYLQTAENKVREIKARFDGGQE